MQNFFFDRRSRKRNRRAEETGQSGDATEETTTPQPPGEERRQTDRRHARDSTLEHYYAVHGMEVDDFSDLEEPAQSEGKHTAKEER